MSAGRPLRFCAARSMPNDRPAGTGKASAGTQIGASLFPYSDAASTHSKGKVVMAGKKKTAKKRRAKPGSTRTSAASARARGGWDGIFGFNPSAWLTTLIGSPTGRAIMAEVLVAAAGAAAAVLMAPRAEARSGDERAAARVGRDTTALMKEAARSAASAAGEVLGGRALAAVGNAAQSMLKDQEPRSSDSAERTRGRNPAH